MQTEWMKPLRRITGAHRPPPPGQHWLSHGEVRVQVRVPPLAAAMVAARLRYFARLVAHGLTYLIALIRSAAGEEWRELVEESCRILQRTVAPKLDSLGDPSTSPRCWKQFARESPIQWAKLIRLFLKACTAEGESQLPEPPADITSDEEWMCGTCGAEFRTQQQLRVHPFRSHGRRRPAWAYVAGSVCPSCGIDFHNRLRAMRHLEKGSQKCQRALQEGRLQAVPLHVLQAADDVDRACKRLAKQTGCCWHAGPPAKRPSQPIEALA